LNKAALKLLVVKGFPMYFQSRLTAAEDILVAKTFRNLGVLPYPTADEDNGQRYHHFTPGQHYADELPAFVQQATRGMHEIIGANHSAVKSVAFHEAKSPMCMRRLHAMIYNMCPEQLVA
jgi:hypothetical protein